MKWTFFIILGLAVIAGGAFYLWPTTAPENMEVVKERPTPYEGKYLDLDRYGFAFLVPVNIEVSSTKMGNASEVLLFTDNVTKEWFQLFITPYGGDSISKESVAKDTGATEVRDTGEVLIGEDQVRAAMFWHEHGQLGEMREIWFIQNGFLYEVTAPKIQDEELARILGTVHFFTPVAPN